MDGKQNNFNDRFNQVLRLVPPRFAGNEPHLSPNHARHRGLGHPAPHFGELHRLSELSRWGAPEAELHVLIDEIVVRIRLNGTLSQVIEADPGRGTPDASIGALDRAAALDTAWECVIEDAMAVRNGRTILVAGEFPPHILDVLLDHASVYQLHPTTPNGYPPPHFHHFYGRKFVGETRLEALVDIQFDEVVFEGISNQQPRAEAMDESALYVSMAVPIVLKAFQESKRSVLEVERRAPHMIARVEDKNIARLPFMM